MIIKIDDLKNIISMIKRNSANIIEEIPQEEIDLYVFIQRQFNKQKSGAPGKKFKKLFLLFYGTRISQIRTYFDKLFDFKPITTNLPSWDIARSSGKSSHVNSKFHQGKLQQSSLGKKDIAKIDTSIKKGEYKLF